MQRVLYLISFEVRTFFLFFLSTFEEMKMIFHEIISIDEQYLILFLFSFTKYLSSSRDFIFINIIFNVIVQVLLVHHTSHPHPHASSSSSSSSHSVSVTISIIISHSMSVSVVFTSSSFFYRTFFT